MGKWNDPHIVFRQNDPDYYPGPDIWNSNNEPPSSCLSQPPVLSSVVWQMVDKELLMMPERQRDILSFNGKSKMVYGSRDPVNRE